FPCGPQHVFFQREKHQRSSAKYQFVDPDCRLWTLLSWSEGPMMKSTLAMTLALAMTFTGQAQAQTSSDSSLPGLPSKKVSSQKMATAPKAKSAKVVASRRNPAAQKAKTKAKPTAAAHSGAANEIARGLQMMKNKNDAKAAEYFFNLSRTARDQNIRMKAKYYLGLALYRLKFKQVAAFPFVDVVRQGDSAQKKKSLDYLLSIADSLDEKSLLTYSLNQVSAGDLTEVTKSVVYNRFAEMEIEKGQYDKAAASLQNSLGQQNGDPYALYLMGMINLKMKQPDKAIPYFQQLTEKYVGRAPRDRQWGMAQMGLARAFYQAHKFAEAAEVYRRLPKNNPAYRESLMELSWALVRQGKFRSSLSPLQTLHTPFYADFFDPESMMLHGIVLLFVCHYDELNPVFTSFDQNYVPAFAKIKEWFQG